MNMQVWKPFPGHNICFYIFGSPAVLSSSLHLPAHSCILCSTAFSGVLLVWVCCARSRTWIWTYRKKISHPSKTGTQEKATGEKNSECQILYFENCTIPPQFVRKCFRLADTIHLCLAALTNYCLQTGSTDAAPAKTSTTKHAKQTTA